MLRGLRLLSAVLAGALWALAAAAAPTPREDLAALIAAPMSLGEDLGGGVYGLLNSGGGDAGYVFETEPMAPLPGFSGAPVNLLVTLDLEGRFLDVRLLEHNEPIFVSGLPESLFRDFFEQYEGHSIAETLVVGSPYGAEGGGGLTYLDGVTKATASVRIAHESLLAATLQVAREKMGGVAAGPPARPRPDHDEALDWDALVAEGMARNLRVTNAEIDALFAGTIWAGDDPEAAADPEGLYLDLWAVDLGPPAVARAVLSDSGQATLAAFSEISPDDEPILLVDAGRHGLVSDDFVRNTAPALIGAEQGGFPVALRDADLLIELDEGVPDALHEAVDYGQALILRTDRRLGFDPAAEWTLRIDAVREHGMFQPETGTVPLTMAYAAAERFFERPEVFVPPPQWLEAVRARAADLAVLAVLVAGLFWAMGPRMERLAAHPRFTAIRLGVLAVVTGFVGWWGQGQLSIVTVLGTVRAAAEGGSFAFLLYDPFGLAVWAAAILGFVLWGRALFCGWLCPFGAMQEFAAHLGRLLRVPQVEPSRLWDARLKWGKYAVLAGLLACVVLAPERAEKAAEVEPFKTAITTFFVREWYFVAYAAFWLVLSTTLFKGFCRYVCPLGAVMALGGLVRGRDWIARRAECGSPCQLCRVKCRYEAIEPSGRIDYAECFGCLDCVAIKDDPARCVPEILAARKGRAAPRPAAASSAPAAGVPAQ